MSVTGVASFSTNSVPRVRKKGFTASSIFSLKRMSCVKDSEADDLPAKAKCVFSLPVHLPPDIVFVCHLIFSRTLTSDYQVQTSWI